MDLQITNVVNISVSEAQTGVGQYNTSNLALFSLETPGTGFGSDDFKIYLDPSEVATDFGTGSTAYKMANSVFSQQPNILAGGGYLVILPYGDAGETLNEAITRTEGLVQYFGIMPDGFIAEQEMLDAAAVVQAMNKMIAFVSNTPADVETGGKLDLLRSSGYSQSRGLYYGGTEAEAMLFMSAYMGAGLSVDFTGSNTTTTRHLKDLIGISADPLMTQTLLTKCVAAGVDTYVSLQGVAKIFCSGTNSFFDQVYNLRWFAGALTVAGFNYLATSNTKIPQTEQGMDGLKGAYRLVCEQAVANQYSAPGTWTSSTTFGKQEDFLNNIKEAGYYIYSSPISAQSSADRVARKAPLIQIALKEAGAIHSSNVVVNINA